MGALLNLTLLATINHQKAHGVSTARPLNPLFWLGGPMLICVLATVLLATPLRVFGLALPEPVFPLAMAFAWAVIRLIMGQDFLFMWGWYGLVIAAAFGAGFVLMSMDAGAPPNVLAVVWQYLATLALFPFAHRLVERYEDADVRFR